MDIHHYFVRDMSDEITYSTRLRCRSPMLPTTITRSRSAWSCWASISYSSSASHRSLADFSTCIHSFRRRQHYWLCSRWQILRYRLGKNESQEWRQISTRISPASNSTSYAIDTFSFRSIVSLHFSLMNVFVFNAKRA